MRLQLIISYLLISSVAYTQDTTVEIIHSKFGPVKSERLVKLSEPWGMTFLPDGRLLVTEKPGRLRYYMDGELSPPISGVPNVVYHEQGGLLDVEIDPQFSTNGFVYLYFTEAAATQSNVQSDVKDERLGPYQDLKHVVLKGGAIARGRLDNMELKDVRVIWRQTPKTIGRGHFGGRMVFGADGKLYVVSGDRQRFDPAQDMKSTLGKVVRMNSDGTGAEIWSSGHRNPLGAAIHPTTKKLWMHEMGPKHGDELNIPEKGKNYGWPLVSNGDHYSGATIPDHSTNARFARPVTYWHPAISPSGMAFYTGSLFKDWNGNLFIGSLSTEVLVRLELDGEKVKSEERINLHKRIRDVIQAPDGSIWLLTDYKDGELLRLTPIRQ